MPPLPQSRDGQHIEIRRRPLEFSFWPMYRGSRRYGLQAHVYSTNPWALIETAVRDHTPSASQAEAIAVLAQARYFFDAATTATDWAAKPLPFYYSLLNLAKALALKTNVRATFDQAQHGLSERLAAGGKEIVDASLEAFTSPGPRGPNVFSDFWQALTGTGLAAQATYPVTNLLPQIVAGHRLWCGATRRRERFISLFRICLKEDTANQIWMELQVLAGDLSRLGITQGGLLLEARLDGDFRQVRSDLKHEGRKLLRYEQITPLRHTHRAADRIQDLVAQLKPKLWATATAIPPYRKYYAYAAPTSEHASVLPQLVSIYAVAFYLGSITRYRPQHFRSLLSGNFGEHIQEFLATQPNQVLYLLASEFSRRVVTRAALV